PSCGGSVLERSAASRAPRSFPTRRSSDLGDQCLLDGDAVLARQVQHVLGPRRRIGGFRRRGAGQAAAAQQRGGLGLRQKAGGGRSEEHTSELQSRENLVCRLLLEKKKQQR